MKERILKFFNKMFLLTLINLSICVTGVSCNEKNKFKEIDLPPFDGGYDVKQGDLKDLHTKYLNYKLKINFPANDVLSFYNSYFTNGGFIPYSEDGYGKSIWENFNHQSGEWESTDTSPARYIATWVDSEKKIRIILTLFYKFQGHNTKETNLKNQLAIEVKVTDFFDFREEPIPTE